MPLDLSSIGQTDPGITVGPIQHYTASTSWFVLENYSTIGSSTGLVEKQVLNFSRNQLWVIDSKQLALQYNYSPRIAYLDEGAGYRNQIQLSATGTTNDTVTVFQDFSGYPGNAMMPSANGPLYRGDWVQLSTIQAGTNLNFILIPNNDPKKTPLNSDYRLNPVSSVNPLSPAFWITYAKPATTTNGNPFLIMSFEDILGGGDNDYNDGIIAVDIGPENFDALFYSSANLGQHPKSVVQVPFEFTPMWGLLILGLYLGGKRLLEAVRKLQAKQRTNPDSGCR